MTDDPGFWLQGGGHALAMEAGGKKVNLSWRKFLWRGVGRWGEFGFELYGVAGVGK